MLQAQILSQRHDIHPDTVHEKPRGIMFVCKQIFLHGQELFRCVGQLTQECEVEGDSRWGSLANRTPGRKAWQV